VNLNAFNFVASESRGRQRQWHLKAIIIRALQAATRVVDIPSSHLRVTATLLNSKAILHSSTATTRVRHRRCSINRVHHNRLLFAKRRTEAAWGLVLQHFAAASSVRRDVNAALIAASAPRTAAKPTIGK